MDCKILTLAGLSAAPSVIASTIELSAMQVKTLSFLISSVIGSDEDVEHKEEMAEHSSEGKLVIVGDTEVGVNPKHLACIPSTSAEYLVCHETSVHPVSGAQYIDTPPADPAELNSSMSTQSSFSPDISRPKIPA